MAKRVGLTAGQSRERSSKQAPAWNALAGSHPATSQALQLLHVARARDYEAADLRDREIHAGTHQRPLIEPRPVNHGLRRSGSAADTLDLGRQRGGS